jgi:hypothetical protein
LHEDYDKPGERLPKQQRADDREHGDEIGGEPTRHDPSQRPPNDRRSSDCEARIPGDSRDSRVSHEMEKQPHENEEESAGR